MQVINGKLMNLVLRHLLALVDFLRCAADGVGIIGKCRGGKASGDENCRGNSALGKRAARN